MAGQIFINYRRDDTIGSAGRLYDCLAQAFSEKQVFMDVDDIDPGLNFIEVINRAVSKCDVLIALIGPDWLTLTDEQGRRKIDMPEDFVRLEIAAALERDIRVIPVLVENANIPSSIDLPDELKELVQRNALELSHTRFRYDADRLIGAIKRVLEQVEAERKAEAEQIAKEKAEVERVAKETAELERKTKAISEITHKLEEPTSDIDTSSPTAKPDTEAQALTPPQPPKSETTSRGLPWGFIAIFILLTIGGYFGWQEYQATLKLEAKRQRTEELARQKEEAARLMA